MEYALCVVVGYLLAVVTIGKKKAPHKKDVELTDKEKKKAEKAWREYRNFMNYDGFEATDEE